MKLSSLNIFALKLALFSSMLAYMAVDLFLWHGPLWNALHKEDVPAEGQAMPIAQAYGEKISAEQFARYVEEQDWLRGRTEGSTPAQKTALLMELMRSTILRMRARYNDKNLPDVSAEAEAEVQRLASRAKSPEEFDLWLASQGYDSRRSFTRKLEAILKATAQLERAVSPFCEVTDEDVAKHYELLKDELTAPARRPLRHIFLATLGKDAQSVKAQAEEILDKLRRGEADFDTLARRYSEDARTAPLGGDLGMVYDSEDFPLQELPLFGETPLPADEPSLQQSRWGWHILLPGAIEPARQLGLDDVRESLRTAIQSAQYELSVQSYFDQAIRDGFRKNHLRINYVK